MNYSLRKIRQKHLNASNNSINYGENAMNAEKIIIEVKCLCINKTFDCIVPRTITGKALCKQYLGLVSETTNIRFGEYEEAMLVSLETGKPIPSDCTLDEAGIDSGDTLCLV